MVDVLAQSECPGITARRARREEFGGVSQDPIVWQAARGANVMDIDGNVYVDLSAGFAVASVGHSHPKVAAAAAKQAGTLIHAMGDLYPSDMKIALARKLAERTPKGLKQSIFSMAGFEAVEAALKTAVMATGKSGVMAFRGSYHGLGYGALSVTGYRKEFKRPFREQLGRFASHLPYPYCYRCSLGLEYPTCGLACFQLVRSALDDPSSGIDQVGAVIVEPIQGRGGVIVPPDEWLVELAQLCKEHQIMLIFDEIFTGFGRTGQWFAGEHLNITPDLMCLGKAMGGGFPISAVIGTKTAMAGWGLSRGEAIHTSTFSGNPLGCAMALAAIAVLEEEELITRSKQLGDRILDKMNSLRERHTIIGDVRGRGSMVGVELVQNRESKQPASKTALRIVRTLLERGYIVLPSGIFGNVLSIVPPFVLTDEQLDGFVNELDAVLSTCGEPS